MGKIYLDGNNLEEIDSNFLKTLTFFYDSISVGINEFALKVHFDDKIKEGASMVVPPGGLLIKGELKEIATKLWNNNKAEFKESKKIISLCPKEIDKFEEKLVLPYYAMGNVPIISYDLLVPFRQAYFDALNLTPPVHFDFETGTISNPASSEVDYVSTMRIHIKIAEFLVTLFRKAFIHHRLGYEITLEEDTFGILRVLSRLEDIKIGDLNNYQQLKEFFPKNITLSQLFNLSPTLVKDNFDDYSTTLKLVINDLGEVPTLEIYKFRKKDKIKSVFEFVQQLRASNRDISDDDIINEINEHIYNLMLNLKPSRRQIGIDILGNLPSPIILNPVGIFSLVTNAKKTLEINEKYKFAFDFLKFRSQFNKTATLDNSSNAVATDSGKLFVEHRSSFWSKLKRWWQ